MKKYLLLLLMSLIYFQSFSQKIIIDADTGNEMDDLYAIAYLLGKVDSNLIALTAAHFNNADLLTEKYWNGYKTKGIKTMEVSFELNEQLLEYAKREDVLCLKGAAKIIGRAWGGTEPRSSEASQKIIEAASKIPNGEKLVVFTLGPLTNIASAIIEKPSIQDKIVLYMMGANYYPEKSAWDKSEFNIRNDLNAFNYLLNSEVEMHIMTATTSAAFKFDKQETLEKHGDTKLDELLMEKWDAVGAGKNWIMWDLALIIAYFHLEFVTEVSINTPPENRQRKVFVYTQLDAGKMEKQFWEVYDKKFR